MILGPEQIKWNERVISQARRHGWQVYEQARRNKRAFDPGLLLVRGDRILAVWLRTGRRREDRQPDTDRFPAAVERYVWYPADWPHVVSALLIDPGDGAPGA
ncbi:hypothetical protein GCM10010420_39320 [Streptomyces glaucosporus]|uniref:Uncharacterized protein n=1 Tax=Streptomyces glaucosporus TaxID=284044 RepID=A0ABN3IKM7_9ACTN